jgi:chromosome segregation ATPase
MATEKYQVLVEIGIDSKVVKDSIANADRLTAEINKLRAAQKESGIQDAETTAAIKALTQERSRDLRVIQQANSLASETVKGQERLKAELSLLTVQYNNLTTEEQRNTAAGQKMGSQIRALSNELKANESAVGNNARNVGNYTDSIKEALVSLREQCLGLEDSRTGWMALPMDSRRLVVGLRVSERP